MNYYLHMAQQMQEKPIQFMVVNENSNLYIILFKTIFNIFYYFILFLGNINDPGMVPRTLLLVFNSLNEKLMSQCKYKPDKVIAAHILDEKLMESEEDIRNNILNNWSNEKTQVIIIKCNVYVLFIFMLFYVLNT